MRAAARFDFAGARVLVTGGSQGIGLGIARAFAEAGADVIVTGRRAGAADYEGDLSAFGYRCAEMKDPSSIDALVASCERLDVLVSNAGGHLVAEDEWRPETFERAVATALFASFRLAVGLRSQLAASAIEGGGSVIHMASMSAFRAVPLVPGYGAAKAALVQLTKNLAAAWARDPVRVNAVAPGLIETRMTAPMKGTPFERPELDRTPMGRWGTPEDVAPAVLFLASSASRFVTGQTLCVDGGQSIA